MAKKILIYDDSTKRIKVSTTLIDTIGGSFTDYDFDISSSGGQSTFDIGELGGDVTADGIIDAWINGTLNREGASDDFQRDANNDEINYNYTIPENAWVRIRIYA